MSRGNFRSKTTEIREIRGEKFQSVSRDGFCLCRYDRFATAKNFFSFFFFFLYREYFEYLPLLFFYFYNTSVVVYYKYIIVINYSTRDFWFKLLNKLRMQILIFILSVLWILINIYIWNFLFFFIYFFVDYSQWILNNRNEIRNLFIYFFYLF